MAAIDSTLSSRTRRAIVAEAGRWIGTPFHHRQRCRGQGVDCINLLIGVYHNVGLVPDIDPGHYPRDWHLHRDQQRMLDAICEHAVPVSTAQPGDAALFRYGRAVSHAAIIVDDEFMIHAWVNAGRVERTERTTLMDRLDSYWSIMA